MKRYGRLFLFLSLCDGLIDFLLQYEGIHISLSFTRYFYKCFLEPPIFLWPHI